MRPRHQAPAAVIALVVLIGSAIIAVAGAKAPDVGSTPIERGKYLVENVAHCFMCHSPKDWDAGHGQPIPGMKGGGDIIPPEESGLKEPFRLVCPNISPDRETGAGTWTDEQLRRAIHDGIGHDGRVLILMPYFVFRNLPDEDISAIIAYIRTIPPVRNKLPPRNLPFNPEVDFHPEMQPPLPPADASTMVKRGAYLASVAGCVDCHSSYDEKQKLIPGSQFGGGLTFIGPWGTVVTPNITRDPSGIPYFDEAQFVRAIRTGHVGARKLAPIMPWSYFRRMSDDDLKAIFAYLRTVPPVKHRVDNTEVAKYCKICRQKHGFGDKN